MNRLTADEIAHRIVQSLLDMPPLREAWEPMDEDIKFEIQREWARIAMECDE